MINPNIMHLWFPRLRDTHGLAGCTIMAGFTAVLHDLRVDVCVEPFGGLAQGCTVPISRWSPPPPIKE